MIVWKIDAAKTQDHWLELTGHIEDADDDVWYEAQVKWDGCIHFRRFFNVPRNERGMEQSLKNGEMDNYLHICDLDEMIAGLQALRKEAAMHFKDHHYRAFPGKPE